MGFILAKTGFSRLSGSTNRRRSRWNYKAPTDFVSCDFRGPHFVSVTPTPAPIRHYFFQPLFTSANNHLENFPSELKKSPQICPEKHLRKHRKTPDNRPGRCHPGPQNLSRWSPQIDWSKEQPPPAKTRDRGALRGARRPRSTGEIRSKPPPYHPDHTRHNVM